MSFSWLVDRKTYGRISIRSQIPVLFAPWCLYSLPGIRRFLFFGTMSSVPLHFPLPRAKPGNSLSLQRPSVTEIGYLETNICTCTHGPPSSTLVPRIEDNKRRRHKLTRKATHAIPEPCVVSRAPCVRHLTVLSSGSLIGFLQSPEQGPPRGERSVLVNLSYSSPSGNLLGLGKRKTPPA